MNRRMAQAALFAAVCGLVWAGQAGAAHAQLAREGKFQARITWTAEAQQYQLGDDRASFAQVKGIETGEGGGTMGRDATTLCVSIAHSAAPSGFGYCAFTDADGDQAFLRLEGPAIPGPYGSPGKWRFTGGTGKFAGISGEGAYVNARATPGYGGTVQGYSDYTGEYRLP